MNDLAEFRHTFGTLMAHRGARPKMIQELLGHSLASTTLDLYTHSFSRLHKDAVRGLEDYLSETGR